MPLTAADRDRLRQIKTFPSLVKYLRDDLQWPIDTDDFEDITFEYTPEELGIDAATAAKIQDIKQLRPLETGQPWGVFFVKFEPKQLPVVALRRILGKLVVKKRASANKADRAAWDKHDLLFISNYGEGEERQITFAHFTDNGHHGDLPTLKVLGWDQQDTALHLDQVHADLHQHLRWPDNPADLTAWRKQWGGAFALKHREVIDTSKKLALRLADLARDIRKRANAAMRIETEDGPLRSLMKSFQVALIHDLKEDDFADMYAQTISYGLLSARVSRPAGMTANDLSDMVPPQTNPFLKELLETFLNIGGRKWNAKRGKLTGIDFDELGINDVVDTLRAANMEAVLIDFGNRNPTEDPVIHFYELFLKEYDAKKRMQRGVFYTPKPVVSYIVRSVHELLQTEFGLPDGLADTTTWGEMIARQLPSPSEGEGQGEGAPRLTLPTIKVKKPNSPDLIDQPIDPTTPFVQILDPATGTATFLVEVIDIIHKTKLAKWKKAGHMELELPGLWNEYVPKHLLPRLHGYELMMAPYAIAHMKIGLKLFETGYKFGSGERARIYLTNALEPPQDFSDTFEQMAPALAHEAKAVNDVKRHQRFTVVIGNPPYAGVSANLTPHARRLIDAYRLVDGVPIKEKGALQFEKNLNDDYVKFVRFAELQLEPHVGVLGYITNNGFLESATLRGMRNHLLSTFSRRWFVDLHGDADKREVDDAGRPDENVFDIKRGVTISLLARRPSDASPDAISLADVTVHRADLLGGEPTKIGWLAAHDVCSSDFAKFETTSPSYYFFARDPELVAEYAAAISVAELFGVNSTGFESGRDEILTDFTREELISKIQHFASAPADVIKAEFNVNEAWGKKLFDERASILSEGNYRRHAMPFLFGPFDVRYCFYRKDLLKTNSYSAGRHLLGAKNLAIMVMRQVSMDGAFSHVGVTRIIPNNRAFYSTKGKVSYFPVTLAFGTDGTELHTIQLTSNLRRSILGRSDEDVVAYAYAVLHSPTYRQRYANFLRTDFPHVPVTADATLVDRLVQIGHGLVELHVIEAPSLDTPTTNYTGYSNQVERVSYASGTIWLDKQQTCGFAGVPEAVWNFHIGGYQVCEKWLKDRKGRRLSKGDIVHYQKIVVALSETIRLMKEIDEVIEKHGGWPGAFVTTPIAPSQGSAQPDTSPPAASARCSRAKATEADDSDGGDGDGDGLFQLRAESPVKQGRLFDSTPDGAAAPPAERKRDQDEPRSIDDVSNFEVMIAVRAVFNDGQSRDRDAAIRDVARELGFQRVGDRIYERLDGDLRAAVQRGILLNDRGELVIDCRSISDYPRDHLTKMLTAGMGNAWWDREELITSSARYLGFARTGPAIRDAFKSIINGAIRRGLLESNGPRVRKV